MTYRVVEVCGGVEVEEGSGRVTIQSCRSNGGSVLIEGSIHDLGKKYNKRT